MHKPLSEPFDITQTPDGEYLIVQRDHPALILKPDGRLIVAPPDMQTELTTQLARKGLAPVASSRDQG